MRGSADVRAGLAAAVVEDVVERPLGDLVDPYVVAGALREVIVGLTLSDAATQRIIERVEAVHAAIAAEQRPASAVMPVAFAVGLRAIARLPVTPRSDALFKMLDRPPIRKALRAQVIDTLAAFGRKAASPVAESSLARGLGGISKRALGQIASGPGALSRVASAVSGEVERQVEKRAAEFADTAVTGILEGLVEQATDVTRRDEQAALRVAVIDGLLEMSGAELAGFSPGHATSQVDAVRSAVAAWVSAPEFAPSLEAALQAVLADDMRRSLGDILADFALREAVVKHATLAVERGIAHFVAGEAFERWLTDLLRD